MFLRRIPKEFCDAIKSLLNFCPLLFQTCLVFLLTPDLLGSCHFGRGLIFQGLWRPLMLPQRARFLTELSRSVSKDTIRRFVAWPAWHVPARYGHCSQ